jgi:hypothetical protein
MKRLPKFALIAMLVVGFIITGYLRDFVMINVNYTLDYLKFDQREAYSHSFFHFLLNYSFKQVYYSKYVLTVIFTIINFGLALLLLKTIFNDLKLNRVLIGVYLIVFITALLLFFAGYALNAVDKGYYLSRVLMGFLQSPVPCAMLIFGYPLYQKSVRA